MKTSAVENWRTLTETHHAQSLRAMGESKTPDDFWAPFASSFRVNPRRDDDPVLSRLADEIGPAATLLDVGGGAGRFALPLALVCQHVTVVEPSHGMLKELRAGTEEHNIRNVTAVEGTWEEIDVAPADVVLCSHVMYGVADIVPFVRKLESKANERLLVLMFVDSPQSELTELWRTIHGEERITLPALPDLLRVLWEMEIFPDLEMVGTQQPRTFDDREQALEQLRQRLYALPGTERDRRLEEALEEMLVESQDGLVVRNSKLRRQGLLSWRPGRASE